MVDAKPILYRTQFIRPFSSCVNHVHNKSTFFFSSSFRGVYRLCCCIRTTWLLTRESIYAIDSSIIYLSECVRPCLHDGLHGLEVLVVVEGRGRATEGELGLEGQPVSQQAQRDLWSSNEFNHSSDLKGTQGINTT